MRPLRVLHVTPYFEGAWAYGGIPRVAASLSKGLARRGHLVTVCTTDACDADGRLETPGPVAAGLSVRVFPNLSNTLSYHRQFFTPVGLRRFLRREASRFDVAHLHGHHHLPGVIAAEALSRAGVPYVVAPNGTAPRTEGQRLAKWLFDVTLGRRVLPGASRIIAVTRAERQQLRRLGMPSSKLRVVPNPVDLDDFGSTPGGGTLRRYFGAACGRVIAYLGTLSPRKGVESLVRALALLRRHDTGLVIAGNDLGANATIRRAVRQLGLDHLVRFAGLLVGRRRCEVLARADVVAYAGRREAFGLVPLEALLCGTPVVVANDSGCGEVISQTGGGLLVPPDDPSALAGALATMLGASDDWRRSARRAGDRVRRRFASDVVATEVERVYRELVAN